MSKAIETPATEAVASTALFAVIDEDAFEQIQETARRLYLKSQRGYRGQQLTMQDSYDYWIMVATREFLSANAVAQASADTKTTTKEKKL